jgi:hypothetical protein
LVVRGAAAEAGRQNLFENVQDVCAGQGHALAGEFAVAEDVADLGSEARVAESTVAGGGGQGVTLAGADILHILEEVLPARFGGAPTDYQLVEQDGDRQARVILRVSRRVPLPSPEALRDCFLRELRQFQGGAGASRLWRSTQAVEVVHADPLTTHTGKVLSLHLLGPGSRRPDAS